MSQSQIHVDPEKLRSFADGLTSFVDVVEEQINTLKRNVSHLGDTWRDQEFERFKSEFESAQHFLSQFAEEARQTVPSLKQDAEKIQEYQDFKL
jgi:uncharacterized protein YukE